MSFYFYLNYYILQGIFSEMVPFAQPPECLKCQVMMTMQSHPNAQARVLTAMIKWKCWTTVLYLCKLNIRILFGPSILLPST